MRLRQLLWLILLASSLYGDTCFYSSRARLDTKSYVFAYLRVPHIRAKIKLKHFRFEIMSFGRIASYEYRVADIRNSVQ